MRSRPARPEDVPAIVALLRECLGARWDEEYFRWKHEANPFGPSAGWVAEDGGEIVALRIFLRWRWLSGARELTAFRAVDTAVHPAWRRRGLFSRLTGEALPELAGAGGRFVFNTPNRRSLPGYLGLGWREVGRVPLLVRPLRPVRMAAAALRRSGGDEPLPLSGHGLPRISALLAEGAADRWLEEPAAADADRRLRTPLSPEYLRWRYHSVPGHDYRALHELAGGEGAAVIFHRRRRAGLEEVKIGEVMIRGRRGPVMAADLLERLARAVEADYLLAVAATGTPEREALRAAGFLPARGLGPRLVVRDLDGPEGSPGPAAAAGWRCSLGDMELF